MCTETCIEENTFSSFLLFFSCVQLLEIVEMGGNKERFPNKSIEKLQWDNCIISNQINYFYVSVLEICIAFFETGQKYQS